MITKETPIIRTVKQLKKLIKKDVITFVIQVDLGELYCSSGVDWLNDFAQEQVEVDGAYLSDIDYRVVGCKPGRRGYNEGSVFIEVTASTMEFQWRNGTKPLLQE